MKKIITAILLLNICIGTLSAQKITLKSVSLIPMDLTIQNDPNPRKDANGKPCALIRVGIVGVEDLVFPDAIGKVKRSFSEYMVFVPEGLESLRYQSQDGTISGSVSFADNDIELIESKRVYSVLFETDSQLRAAIIAATPKTAIVTFDGATIPLDEDGMASVLKPVGTYSYRVEAEGYEPRSGSIQLTEDDISSTARVVLTRKQHPLVITCEPPTAKLFVDGQSYGQLNSLQGLQIAEGSHAIRITAEGYEDYHSQLTDVRQAQQLSVSMVKKKMIEIKEKDTKRKVNIRPGIYVHAGGELYDKNKYCAHEWGGKAGVNVMHHFGRFFALREGLHANFMALSDSLKHKAFENIADTTSTSWSLEVPLQVGVSIPIGHYNQHLFSVLAGGYVRSIFTKDADKKYMITWDYGLRLSAQFDIKKFAIQVEVSKSLHDMGMFYGLSVGWRFTSLRKMAESSSSQSTSQSSK